MPETSFISDLTVALSTLRRWLTRPVSLWIACLATVLGTAGGLAWARANPPSPQPETLTGIVTWSNTHTRLIAFEADGEPRDPELGDTIYAVITGNGWQDSKGVIHVDGTYPTCLGGSGPEPVTMDRHRVELTAIRNIVHRRNNVALNVRCLD